MKKLGYYVTGILLVLTVLVFAGCSKDNNGATQSTTKSQSTQTTQTTTTAGTTENNSSTEATNRSTEGMDTTTENGTRNSDTSMKSTSATESTGILGEVVKDVENGVEDLTTGTTAAR